MVQNAKSVPMTDQVRIDREEIWEIIDQMRSTIPEEIKQARWIVKERQEMLAEARSKERETRLAAEDYADGILEHLEVNLGKFLTAVQRGREQLAQGSQERTGGATAGYDVTT